MEYADMQQMSLDRIWFKARERVNNSDPELANVMGLFRIEKFVHAATDSVRLRLAPINQRRWLGRKTPTEYLINKKDRFSDILNDLWTSDYPGQVEWGLADVEFRLFDCPSFKGYPDKTVVDKAHAPKPPVKRGSTVKRAKKDALTTKEAAKVLRTSLAALKTWRVNRLANKDGRNKGPKFEKVGKRRYVYYWQDLLEYKKTHAYNLHIKRVGSTGKKIGEKSKANSREEVRSDFHKKNKRDQKNDHSNATPTSACDNPSNDGYDRSYSYFDVSADVCTPV